mmetsp:Transcript_16473/g.35777  ORF Transcript_16473/g.35777 Transcript_16473/m.35777 type:complete len:263 (-) Transcript_16473:315-1103(-)
MVVLCAASRVNRRRRRAKTRKLLLLRLLRLIKRRQKPRQLRQVNRLLLLLLLVLPSDRRIILCVGPKLLSANLLLHHIPTLLLKPSIAIRRGRSARFKSKSKLRRRWLLLLLWIRLRRSHLRHGRRILRLLLLQGRLMVRIRVLLGRRLLQATCARRSERNWLLTTTVVTHRGVGSVHVHVHTSSIPALTAVATTHRCDIRPLLLVSVCISAVAQPRVLTVRRGPLRRRWLLRQRRCPSVRGCRMRWRWSHVRVGCRRRRRL